MSKTARRPLGPRTALRLLSTLSTRLGDVDRHAGIQFVVTLFIAVLSFAVSIYAIYLMVRFQGQNDLTMAALRGKVDTSVSMTADVKRQQTDMVSMLLDRPAPDLPLEPSASVTPAVTPPSRKEDSTLLALYLTGDKARASELTSAYAAQGRSSATMYLVMGLLSQERGMMRSADIELAEAARLAPDRVDILIARGQLYEARGMFDAGFAIFRTAAVLVSTREDSARVAYHQGICLQGIRRYADAEAALRRAVALNPHDVEASSALASMLLRIGSYEAADSAADRALATRAGMPDALVVKAQLSETADDLDEAANLYWQALQSSPRRADIWLSLGRLNMRRKHYAEAERDLRACVAMNVYNADACAALGEVLMLRRNYSDAQFYLDLAIGNSNRLSDQDHGIQRVRDLQRRCKREVDKRWVTTYGTVEKTLADSLESALDSSNRGR